MKIELDTEVIVDDLLSSLDDENPTFELKQKALADYWSIILLDNLPRLETEIRKELERRGFKL